VAEIFLHCSELNLLNKEIMTKRDFFRLIIKLFGLYSGLLSVFTVIPNNITNVLFQFDVTMLLFIIGTTLVIILLFLFLIFKTDFIIDILKLDKGFEDDRIQFENLNSESIVKIAIFLIGGFLIIDYLPNFLNYTLQAFRSKVQSSEYSNIPVNYFNWIVSGINILLGYILITNYKVIANYLDKK
jgi:hypothetical protein